MDPLGAGGQSVEPTIMLMPQPACGCVSRWRPRPDRNGCVRGEGLFLVMLLVELLLHNDTRECLLANLNLKLCAELRIL